MQTPIATQTPAAGTPAAGTPAAGTKGPAVGTTSGSTANGSKGGSAASLPSGTGTTPNLPPSLATALNGGARLQAQVTTQTSGQASGQAGGQIRTLSVQVPSGTSAPGQTVALPVQTALPLPPGTSLSVSLQSNGPPAVLFLQPNTGGTANQGVSLTAHSGQSAGGAQTRAAHPAFVTSLTQGSLFTATVTGTSNSAAAGSAGAGSSGISSAAVQTKAGGAGATTPANPGARAAPAFPVGTTLQVQLLGFSPPGQMLALPNGGTDGFIATVTGSGSTGTSVQTSAGTLSLMLNNPPPPGAQLLLLMMGQPAIATGSPGSANANRFQALQEALMLLRSGDAAAAQRLTQGLLPQPNAQFGLAAAFLLAALRQGGVDRWLGKETARSLEALGGRGDQGVLARLGAELSRPPGRAKDASGQDWRVTSLPLFGDREIDIIRLYTKPGQDDDPGNAESDPRNRGQRFVIEANFSHTGPIQLDAFSREKQIDIVLRTQTPFAPSERDEIRALFAGTISALGYAGSTRFQVVPAFDLVPDRDDDAPEGVTV